MGQGGFINVVNATTSTWRRSFQHDHQMVNWGFPEEIRPQTRQKVYVEWSSALFKVTGDDGAEVTYTLSDSNKMFQIQARARDTWMLQVFFEGLQIIGNPSGSILQLG